MRHMTNRSLTCRLVAAFLAVLMFMFPLLLHPTLVVAKSSDFDGGSGTEDDPYEIATADQLDKVRDHLDKHFVLTANINLGVSPWNAGKGWEPIGSETAPFTGTFDGNEHEISNLTINKPTTDYAGLFGVTDKDAEISNVKLKDVSITSNSYVGALVGLNNGKIENSSATGDVTGSGDYVGGLVGRNGGSITNSYTTGNVTGYIWVGGLVGGNSGSITTSYATGDVTGSRDYVGGLVGSNGGSVTTSYATGDVTGNNIIGGLVGYNIYGSITTSYATGNVTGNIWVGGLVGENIYGSITTSYATGNITGNNVVGGLVGEHYRENIENSFALNSAINSTRGNIARIVGYSTGTLNNNYALATMTVNVSPISNSNANDAHGANISEQWATTIFPYLDTGWDFTIWQINEGEYPTLRDSKVSAVNPSQPSITTDAGTIVEKDDVFTLKFCEIETKATVSTTVEGDTKFFRWMDANEENQSLEASYDVLLGNEYQLEVVSGTGNRKTYGLEVKPGFDLKLQVNDPLEGSISGTAGCYSEGEEIELKAEANPGYRFVNWTIDGTEESKQATFDYTMPAGDVTIVANFKKIPSSGGRTYRETKFAPVIIDDDVIMQMTFTRTKHPNGKVTDELTLTPEQGNELANKLIELGHSSAQIIIPDENDEIAETNLTLSEEAVQSLEKAQSNIEIVTNNGTITIPYASLADIDEDVFFRIIPIKDEHAKKEVEHRAKQDDIVQDVADGSHVQLITRPVTIETNLQQRPVTLILPLLDVQLPEDESERDAFLNDLVIYIEHSDGEKELLPARLVEYEPGQFGLQFTVHQFSTFAILHIEGAAEYFNENGRLSGANRYETAVAISKAGWKNGAKTVILARGDAFPDALAATPLAYQEDAPILLTLPHQLHEAAKQEIVRLQPDTIVIIGGKGAISETVEQELKGLAPTVERIEGKNRFATAVHIAERVGIKDGLIVANGMNFSDALAVASYAAREGVPILLTQADQLPEETKNALQHVKRTRVVGGEMAVSATVYQQLPSPQRIHGANRYGTASQIIATLDNRTAIHAAYVASGMDFPDALAGSVLAAKENKPILLVQPDRVPQETKAIVNEKGIKTFTVFGGQVSVHERVMDELKGDIVSARVKQ